MKVTAKNLRQLRKHLMKAITIGDTPFGRGSSGHVAQPFLPDPLAATFIDIVTEYNNFRNVFRAVPMKSRGRARRGLSANRIRALPR